MLRKIFEKDNKDNKHNSLHALDFKRCPSFAARRRRRESLSRRAVKSANTYHNFISPQRSVFFLFFDHYKDVTRVMC